MSIRRTAVACTCLAIGVLLFASSASAALSDVQTPTVSGPIVNSATSHPFGGTDIDLKKYGYTEEEYYVSGNAYSYDTSTPLATATKITTGGPASDGLWPYITRITVRRPISPADFNGTTVVEWNNVTATFDLEANWDGDPYYLLNNGYAWVGVSTQRIGIASLKGFNPARYGSLDIPDPNAGDMTAGVDHDSLSYEVYSAVIKALRGAGAGVDPLAGLNPQTVIASGESQSGSRLSTYYNAIQPIHEMADAFLLTVSTRALRTNRPEKAIRVLSENENKNKLAEADTNTLRHWEVAGASHLPYLAYQNFTGPITRDLGMPLVADCTKNPLSRVEWPFVVNSAMANLVSWTRGGAAPPISPRGTYTAPTVLMRDSFGIAGGGIRLPAVTTPVGTNTGVNTAQPGTSNPFSLFCGLLGSYEVFSQDTLNSLYPDFGAYIDQVRARAEAVSSQGFVLPQDTTRLVDQAEQFPQIRPTAPARVSGKPRNRGQLKLTWFGTKAPSTTFRLQHALAKSEKWSTVRGAGALSAPEFTFTKSKPESEGKWRYRVLSTTNIPATPILAAYVVATPFSEPGGSAVVDRTKPKVKVSCPKRIDVGAKAFAKVRATDKVSGLRKKPRKKIRIASGKPGKRTLRVRVVDKVGNVARGKCVTRVIPG